MSCRKGLLGALVLASAFGPGCQGAQSGKDGDGTDTATGPAPDGGTDSEDAGDAGADAGEITFDCSWCAHTGITPGAMLCAFEACDPDYAFDSFFISPTNTPIVGTHAAVKRFGVATNGLAPKGEDSYALLATGPALGTSHSIDLGGIAGADPYANDDYPAPIYNAMEWSIVLKAPKKARGFSFNYVFFSEEYDDFVGTSYNDKFYVFLESESTNGGKKTIINFTSCRQPALYNDFLCPSDATYCEPKEPYCYIAINSAYSDCCWYNNCPNPQPKTDIAGTGFECAASSADDGLAHGSSTGWLKTSWPIRPEEQFKLTFHVHDTNDGSYDSEVILDNFHFLSRKPDTGTVKPE
ncbi:MAG: choice-of-anchor L domain-containing protein [Deltaproteobacteria bacterium]|nr:choice-of-anchor L domain-containing protein [Deltaproteobacteria bacterium]